MSDVPEPTVKRCETASELKEILKEKVRDEVDARRSDVGCHRKGHDIVDKKPMRS